jgi:hypothetical protein
VGCHVEHSSQLLTPGEADFVLQICWRNAN